MSGNNLELMHTLVGVNFILISTISDGPLLNSDTAIHGAGTGTGAMQACGGGGHFRPYSLR